jgi:LCP family protein required for cell wall assembly
MKQGRSLKEAKAERAAKKRRAKRRRRAIVLIIEILVLFVLLGIGYILTKYGKLQLNLFEDGEIHFNIGAKQEDYKTIALFGGDSREGELDAGTHADTIMIVSIDNKTKEVKVLSVYRDLMTKQIDGKIRKANSAYFLGGPKEAINMLNLNFDLDIEDYVTVDFKAMAVMVDLLGGIDVDVKENEAAEMNNYINESAQVVGGKATTIRPGMQTLDGVGALTYARIRKDVGGDYARTERQRVVIQKMLEKVKSTDLKTINQIINEVFGHIATSFTMREIIELAPGLLKYELAETAGYAFERTDGNIQGIGSVVVPVGVTENVQKMHQFLYPTLEYQVSEVVKNIATEIEILSGQQE